MGYILIMSRRVAKRDTTSKLLSSIPLLNNNNFCYNFQIPTEPLNPKPYPGLGFCPHKPYTPLLPGLRFFHGTQPVMMGFKKKKLRERIPPPPVRIVTDYLANQFDNSLRSLPPKFEPEDVLNVLERQMDPDVALDIFQWSSQQRHYKHTADTYEAIINILAKGLRFNALVRIMEDAIAGACKGTPRLYNTIMTMYCDFNRLSNAITVFKKMQRMPDCKPTVVTYNILLQAMSRKQGDAAIGRIYAENMNSIFMQMKSAGVEPDTLTLNFLVKGHSKAHHMYEAIAIYREFKLYNLSPTRFTYDYLIRGFCEINKVHKALKMYESMVKSGFHPSRRTYNVLVSCLAMNGRALKAVEVLSLMSNNHRVLPDIITYKTVVEELCGDHKKHEAMALLRESRRRRFIDDAAYDHLVKMFELENFQHSLSPHQWTEMINSVKDELIVGDMRTGPGTKFITSGNHVDNKIDHSGNNSSRIGDLGNASSLIGNLGNASSGIYNLGNASSRIGDSGNVSSGTEIVISDDKSPDDIRNASESPATRMINPQRNNKMSPAPSPWTKEGMIDFSGKKRDGSANASPWIKIINSVVKDANATDSPRNACSNTAMRDSVQDEKVLGGAKSASSFLKRIEMISFKQDENDSALAEKINIAQDEKMLHSPRNASSLSQMTKSTQDGPNLDDSQNASSSTKITNSVQGDKMLDDPGNLSSSANQKKL